MVDLSKSVFEVGSQETQCSAWEWQRSSETGGCDQTYDRLVVCIHAGNIPPLLILIYMYTRLITLISIKITLKSMLSIFGETDLTEQLVNI